MARTQVFVLICLLFAARTSNATDRAAELKKLIADYEAAETEFYATKITPPLSVEQKIDRYRSYPRWAYLPQILALAEADRTDQTALIASKWIIQQSNNLGPQWGPLFAAERTAWQILCEQELPEEDISQQCLDAVRKSSPAREEFLRTMATRDDLSGDSQVIASLALAEYLAHRFAEAEEPYAARPWWTMPQDEYYEFLKTQLSQEWIDYVAIDDPKPLRLEGIELFRRLLAENADTPFLLTAPYFRDLKTVGDKARKSLHALEHLYIGAMAPDFDAQDLEGNSIKLSDHRGKVVLLSFWFTGCGPCIAALPEEQKVVEKFRDRPFALIGVCRDENAEISKKTAADHGMTWPSVSDGKPGSVTTLYNVSHWPTFYLIDAEGRIVSKNVVRDGLSEAVDAVLSDQREAVTP